jgi:hypothetical protein
VRNSGLKSSFLETMSLLLIFPTCLAAPLLYETISVPFNEGLFLIVRRFKKKGDAENRECDRARRIG